MGMVKNFLDANPDGGVVYFESESAITKQMVIDRGGSKKNGYLTSDTVQDFRTQAIKVADRYNQQDVDLKKFLCSCV